MQLEQMQGGSRDFCLNRDYRLEICSVGQLGPDKVSVFPNMRIDVPGSFRLWRYKKALRSANQARSDGNWESAYRGYVNSLAFSPDNGPIWVQRGHAAKQSGRIKEAEDAYLTAHRLQPDDIGVQVQLGHFFKDTGRVEMAIAYYRSAIAAGSADIHAKNYVCSTISATADELLAKGNVKQAARLYEEVNDIQPDFHVLMRLGSCCRDLGRLDDAKRAYRSAAKIRPDDADCVQQLEQVLALVDHPKVSAPPPLPRRAHIELPERAGLVRERIEGASAHRWV